MPAPADDLTATIASAAADYESNADVALLHQRLDAIAQGASVEALVQAAAPFRDRPDVIAPLYERVVSAEPANAQAKVVLANAYWLQGRGPDAVGRLASEAIAVDPGNRGAWHLWALSEPDPRQRTQRWEQVTQRFPADLVALAAMADNAASVAGAEHDYAMLDEAIISYERLLERSTEPAQRDAVNAALRILREWKF